MIPSDVITSSDEVYITSTKPLNEKYGDFIFNNSTTSSSLVVGQRHAFLDAPPGDYVAHFKYEFEFTTNFTLGSDITIVIDDTKRSGSEDAPIEYIECIYRFNFVSWTNIDSNITDTFTLVANTNAGSKPDEQGVQEINAFLNDIRTAYKCSDGEITFESRRSDDQSNVYGRLKTSVLKEKRFAVCSYGNTGKFPEIALFKIQGPAGRVIFKDWPNIDDVYLLPGQRLIDVRPELTTSYLLDDMNKRYPPSSGKRLYHEVLRGTDTQLFDKDTMPDPAETWKLTAYNGTPHGKY